MCNKYKEFSKVNEYEKHELVEKMNKAMDNFDFKKEIKKGTHMCLACIYECKGCNFENKCLLFEKMPSIKEYWIMIKEDNVDLDKLCKLYELNKNTLYKMLNNKIPMDEYYARCLNARLFIAEEFEPYINEKEFELYTDEVDYGEK